MPSLGALPDAPAPTGQVSISLAAQLLNAQSSAHLDPNNWGTAQDRFEFGVQVSIEGENATLLQNLPDSHDPGRLALARQAVDFVLERGVNPMAGLPREMLSRIAFDGTDTFTPAERSAASSQIGVMDVEWQRALAARSVAQPRDLVAAMDAKYNLAMLAGMSEAEKAQTHLRPAEAYQATIRRFEGEGGKIPDFGEYPGALEADGHILVSSTDEHGVSSWTMLSTTQRQADGSHKNLLHLIAQQFGNSSDRTSASNAGWLTLYATDGKSQSLAI